jgi:large subunit ribosomal protein L4
MQIDVVNIEGQKVGQMDVADAVFATKVKDSLLWEAVKAQQAAKRKGTHATKTRMHVRGGGRKPFRQKGTGNARQGSIRSPNYVGGGVVFGPHPRSYEYTLPRKVKKAALASALSLRAQEKKLVVVDKLVLEAPKSKRMAGVLKALGFDSALVVDAKGNQNLVKSIRNLAAHACLPPEGLNVYDILNHGGLVIAKDAVKAVEARVIGNETEGQAA